MVNVGDGGVQALPVATNFIFLSLTPLKLPGLLLCVILILTCEVKGPTKVKLPPLI